MPTRTKLRSKAPTPLISQKKSQNEFSKTNTTYKSNAYEDETEK